MKIHKYNYKLPEDEQYVRPIKIIQCKSIAYYFAKATNRRRMAIHFCPSANILVCKINWFVGPRPRIIHNLWSLESWPATSGRSSN